MEKKRDKRREFMEAYGFDIETRGTDGTPMFTTTRGGTITGRMSSTVPNFHEREPRSMKFPEIPASAVDVDLSDIEARVFRWMSIDKNSLSAFDQARRFNDLYGSGPRKLSAKLTKVDTVQLAKQAAAAEKQMQDWHLKMIADGYTCVGDAYLKEDK